MSIIRISSKEKSTTIRLKQKTKEMLEELSKGKETHEEIILRLIKTHNNLSLKESTKLLQKGNIIGTKYEKIHKTINFKLDNNDYVVVCKFNDLSIFSVLRNKSIKEISNFKNLDWRIDLEIININKGKGWENPKNVSSKEINLLYFICLKLIIEEMFDLNLYHFSNIEDYFNIDNWIETYNKYDLSRDSLNNDVKRKL